jgi:CBS domain-containing protein
MIVRELLGSNVLSCTTDLSAVDAARQMVQSDAGSLAVMSDEDLVGIVTERDLIRLLADPADGATVGEIMTPDPDSLEPEVDIGDAADWMLAAGYRHLPVVEGGRLIGIVSIKDVLWGLRQGRAGR